MFGSVFGIALSRSNALKEDQLVVVGTILEVFAMPATACAQDTGNTGPSPPPTIPRDP
jgi:hypothetical protein